MKKLILASAALMATFGMETGITPVDNVFVQEAVAQSNGQTRCNMWNARNFTGTNRVATTSGTINGNLGGNHLNRTSSVRVRVRSGGNTAIGTLRIYNRADQRQFLDVFSATSTNEGQLASFQRELDDESNNRTNSFTCSHTESQS